jgi:hypothetical protein
MLTANDEPIRAEIIGNHFEAEGVTAPTLRGLCVKLLAVGFHPGRSLETFRGDTFDQLVSAIGIGRDARHAVKTYGTPHEASHANGATLTPVPPSKVYPVKLESSPEDDSQTELYRRATQCWQELKSTARRRWEQFDIIGQAMLAARTETMRKAGTNRPYGVRYRKLWAEWLRETGLKDMNSATRSLLLKLIRNRVEVEMMMRDWNDSQRADRCHPSAIHRYWKEYKQSQSKAPPAPTVAEPHTEVTPIAATTNKPEPQVPANAAGAKGKTPKPKPQSAAERQREKRKAERQELKRRTYLENTLTQINRSCEFNEEMELPQELTAAQRDDAINRLQKDKDEIDLLIERLRAAPVRK